MTGGAVDMDQVVVKVLAETQDLRGPMFLEFPIRLEMEQVDRVKALWDEAFRRAGREPPVLFILDAGVRFTAWPAPLAPPAEAP